MPMKQCRNITVPSGKFPVYLFQRVIDFDIAHQQYAPNQFLGSYLSIHEISGNHSTRIR